MQSLATINKVQHLSALLNLWISFILIVLFSSSIFLHPLDCARVVFHSSEFKIILIYTNPSSVFLIGCKQKA